MALIFGLSFVFSIILAIVIHSIANHDGFVYGALYYITNKTFQPEAGSEAARWLEFLREYPSDIPITPSSMVLFMAFLIGGGVSLPVIATNALFERKSFKYVAVNAGYWMLCATIMGAILAVWV